MGKIVKILLFFFLVFAKNVNSKSPPPGTGTSDIPANIMIMLDNSGSMGWNLDGSTRTINTERATDIAFDSSGNIYVLRTNYNDIKVFNSSGILIRTIGGGYGSACSGTAVQFATPYSIAIKDNIIYIADYNNRRIVYLNLDGTCNGRPLTLDFRPSGIAAKNRLYVGEWDNNRLFNLPLDRSFTNFRMSDYQRGEYFRGSNLVQIIAGAAFGQINVNAAGTKLVSQQGRGRIQVCNLSAAGFFSGEYPSIQINLGGSIGTVLRGSTSTQGGYPNCGFGISFSPQSNSWDADFDSSGNIYVTDPNNYRLLKFNSSGNLISTVGSYNNPFLSPLGIKIDSNDKIFIADSRAGVLSYNTSLIFQSRLGANIRMDIAKSVIKKIVSNTELTSKANFGLMEWGSPYATSNGGLRIRVPISSSGAKTIFTNVDGVIAYGGTYLNNALSLARSYYGGSAGYPSPIISGASCQLNYLIVISDGEWADPSGVVSTATALANQTPPIKTFAVGLALGSSSTNYSNLAVAGGTKVPLYASNEQELLAALTDAIKQAISSTLTFSAPAVTSEITKDNFIYQSTFSYAPNKQWEGSLKKYKLNADSTIGNLEWDAGAKLNSKSASSRQLWTAGLSGTGLNNFTTTYRSELKNQFQSSLTSSDAQVDKLINFVRGVDTYDQDADGNTSEERHKLNDIYHSQISIVGPPSSSIAYTSIYEDSYYRSVNSYTNFTGGGICGGGCANRREIVLAGSNAGILHAFDASSGEELWGFIPPSMLNKLPKIISSTPNVTNAIFGVDGSPVVKDIYYGGAWRTIVLTGLGRGGNSYFALDITNPNSPTHLFTIENDDIGKVVNFWNSSGAKTSYFHSSVSVADDTKDYSKLGEAWSTPRIIRMRINNVDKWVAVFGGGFNGGVNPNLGSSVFVMDLENNGDLVKKIDIADKANAIPNSVPSDLVAITANGTAKAQYYGAMVYVPDYEGKITKINLTSAGTLYESTQLFDADSSTTNGRYILNGAEATINSNKLWLYFGTGDSEKLGDQITGTQNRVYGIKDVNFPNFVALSRSEDISNCKTAPNCPLETDLGWYVDLTKSQKVTASPTLDVDRVYFPIYEPSSDINNRCGVGNAILKAFSRNCGEALLRANMGQGVLSKVVKRGDYLYVGIAGKANTNIGQGFTSNDNLITGKSEAKPVSGAVQIESWKENY